MGVHKMIKSPEILKQLFLDYKKDAKDNPKLVQDYVGKDADEVYRKKEVPLTMEGFEEYVAEQPDMPLSLDAYFANREGRYEEFVSICHAIKRAIRKDQIEGGMVGIYNPSITQRLNGLADKKEVENSGQITIQAPKEDHGLGE